MSFVVVLVAVLLLAAGSASPFTAGRSLLADGGQPFMCKRSLVSSCAYRYGGRHQLPNYTKTIAPQGDSWRI